MLSSAFCEAYRHDVQLWRRGEASIFTFMWSSAVLVALELLRFTNNTLCFCFWSFVTICSWYLVVNRHSGLGSSTLAFVFVLFFWLLQQKQKVYSVYSLDLIYLFYYFFSLCNGAAVIWNSPHGCTSGGTIFLFLSMNEMCGLSISCNFLLLLYSQREILFCNISLHLANSFSSLLLFRLTKYIQI